MLHRHLSRPLRLFAIVSTVLLALAACNGGNGDTEPETDDTTPEAAATATVSADADVSFASPQDGDEVTSPVAVEMQAENFTVEESGEVNDDAGHFHIMVDTDCLAAGEEIPNDEQHLHFGDGSMTAELELEPGEHTLCLQAADGAHIAYDLTDEITITVTE